ncbi:MAG: hypothetical protein ISR65_15025 [Bacteriovoracaceae bacterium]|nr:hypothetical protein [Bacteriovoracaceae bacterium]
MDQANIVIQFVKALTMPQIEIIASNGIRYISDLKEYSSIKCFPTSQKDWEKVGVTTYGFNLTWASRFEVHVDQVIACAISEESIKLQA